MGVAIDYKRCKRSETSAQKFFNMLVL